MDNALGPVWVVAEQRDCNIRTVSLQLMGRAKELARQLGTQAEAVMLGHHMAHRLKPLMTAGASRIYLGEHSELEVYEPEIYVETLLQLARQYEPEIILIGSTAMGRELAPLLAAGLKTGLRPLHGFKSQRRQYSGADHSGIRRAFVHRMSAKTSPDGNSCQRGFCHA